MKKTLAQFVSILLFALPLLSTAERPNKDGEFYQITIYHFSTGDQQKLIDQYLQQAYLPALHRQKLKNIGVFTAIANDTAADKRLYLVIPIKSLKQVTEITENLAGDNEYQLNGKTYLEATYKTPPYTRMEKILTQAFPLAPFLTLPKLTGPAAERVYELRSYESATEKIFQNKVQMFNEGGEIALFKQLNFNAVFYSSVIAGSNMPNLMYMTSFENMADRNAHWKSFGASPEWKKLSAMPEYQNNVSKNTSYFLHTTPYSDY
ncbi:MAG: family containing protein [Ferruginibacter sp.]|nr:family containing protein [Ferruginibacter sp.]